MYMRFELSLFVHNVTKVLCTILLLLLWGKNRKEKSQIQPAMWKRNSIVQHTEAT